MPSHPNNEDTTSAADYDSRRSSGARGSRDRPSISGRRPSRAMLAGQRTRARSRRLTRLCGLEPGPGHKEGMIGSGPLLLFMPLCRGFVGPNRRCCRPCIQERTSHPFLGARRPSGPISDQIRTKYGCPGLSGDVWRWRRFHVEKPGLSRAFVHRWAVDVQVCQTGEARFKSSHPHCKTPAKRHNPSNTPRFRTNFGPNRVCGWLRMA
jgi:hypothetical protein